MFLMKAEQDGNMSLEKEEKEIAFLQKKLDATLGRNAELERDNQELRCEVARLNAQVNSLRAHDNERKNMLWKKLQNHKDNSHIDASQQKLLNVGKASEKMHPRQDSSLELLLVKDVQSRVSTSPLNSLREMNGKKIPSVPAPPLPPPSPLKLSVGLKSVRRVPEVIEMYRLLTRKDVKSEIKNKVGNAPGVAFTRNMIGEIENRSTYLSAIKSDVEKQGEFINVLIKEVESAAFRDISEVEAFVKWLDERLSSLVDERAVLKHFPQWPERKVDTLREAACTYKDLKDLESQVLSYADKPSKEPLRQAMKKLQALQDRLEAATNSIESRRESMIKKYREFLIPWEWIQNSGLIYQLKLSSLGLAREYMNRVTGEMLSNDCSPDDDILLQGVRFAYKFAGGFDNETIHAFEELKTVSVAKCKQVTCYI